MVNGGQIYIANNNASHRLTISVSASCRKRSISATANCRRNHHRLRRTHLAHNERHGDDGGEKTKSSLSSSSHPLAQFQTERQKTLLMTSEHDITILPLLSSFSAHPCLNIAMIQETSAVAEILATTSNTN